MPGWQRSCSPGGGALTAPLAGVQVDICPEHVLKHTLESLQTILKKPGVKKRPFMVIASLLLKL